MIPGVRIRLIPLIRVQIQSCFGQMEKRPILDLVFLVCSKSAPRVLRRHSAGPIVIRAESSTSNVTLSYPKRTYCSLQYSLLMNRILVP